MRQWCRLRINEKWLLFEPWAVQISQMPSRWKGGPSADCSESQPRHRPSLAHGPSATSECLCRKVFEGEEGMPKAEGGQLEEGPSILSAIAEQSLLATSQTLCRSALSVTEGHRSSSLTFGRIRGFFASSAVQTSLRASGVRRGSGGGSSFMILSNKACMCCARNGHMCPSLHIS